MDSVGLPVLTELVIDVPSVTSNSFEDATKQSSSWILTRLHAGYFRINLSFCGQTLLWKTFGESDFYNSLIIRPKLPSAVFVLLWSVSLIMLSLISLLYILRCFFHFNMVKAEFLHHVGVNYLFVPWISWLLLLQSSPFMSPKSVQYVVVFWLFVIPVALLNVKIYGQWFTKGKRFLSAVANPASQLSVIANLVAARAAAKMGWMESAIFFFSIGITHYVVIFVTLYQRPIGIYRLPAKLRPVFFLFIAAPSTASVAWDSVSGSFGTPSKILFYLSFFHFASLVIKLPVILET
ncbi:S-type anion channel slah1 [Thalictrum thalictroides]|uniref:S-type anion channel slah1 n=1 Tax=Thalictrum thalictroides TaxID=46969 RepID=A0A7J6W603_THATH|nr:S-type anion channel slah1 [Thalictrum thalictroides]